MIPLSITEFDNSWVWMSPRRLSFNLFNAFTSLELYLVNAISMACIRMDMFSILRFIFSIISKQSIFWSHLEMFEQLEWSTRTCEVRKSLSCWSVKRPTSGRQALIRDTRNSNRMILLKRILKQALHDKTKIIYFCNKI